MKYFVTGAAGFIGSNFVRYVLDEHPDSEVLSYDKLTYAGNLENLDGLSPDRHQFVRGDICDREVLQEILSEFEPDFVVNFAAESHVDRSIKGADPFVETNVDGTQVLLDVFRERTPKRFVQVSTDGGNTWTSLSNADTCSDLNSAAHPKVAANVPGFTGASGFDCSPGDEAEWITTSFDLSAYDGQQILVAFRYVTDWAFNQPGWWVDNVNVAGVFTSDGSSTDGFQGLNEVLGIENEFTVTLIGERNRQGQSEYEVRTILSGDYKSDWTSVREMFDNYRSLVMLVTYDAPEGTSTYADYSFEIVGNPRVAEQAVSCLRPTGQAVLVGVPPAGEQEIGLDLYDMVVSEKGLIGSFNGSYSLPLAIPRLAALAARGDLRLDPLITDSRPLTELNEAMHDLETGTGIRQVIRP
jgi:hypothetical protein